MKGSVQARALLSPDMPMGKGEASGTWTQGMLGTGTGTPGDECRIDLSVLPWDTLGIA